MYCPRVSVSGLEYCHTRERQGVFVPCMALGTVCALRSIEYAAARNLCRCSACKHSGLGINCHAEACCGGVGIPSVVQSNISVKNIVIRACCITKARIRCAGALWVKHRPGHSTCGAAPGLIPRRRSPASLFPFLSFLEPQIDADLRVKIAVHLVIEGWLQAFKLKPRSAPE